MEVLLAGVVLVVGMLAVIRSYRSSLQMARENSTFFQAALLTEGQMGELERVGDVRNTRTTDPVLGETTTSDEIREGDEVNWTEHRMTVAWGKGNDANNLQLTTFLAN